MSINNYFNTKAWHTHCVQRFARTAEGFRRAKAEEYAYWQSRPIWERVAAVAELSEQAYRMKGMEPDAEALRRTVVVLKRERR